MIEGNRDILRALRGDTVLAARNENVPDLDQRAGRLRGPRRRCNRSAGRPATQKEQYAIAAKEFAAELAKLTEAGGHRPARAGEEARRLRRAVDPGPIANVGEVTRC